MADKKRIFIGIPASEELQKMVTDWKNSRNDLLGLPIRWVNGKNLHLTLAPPWYEDNVEQIGIKLDSLAGFRNFEIEFIKICYGPNLSNPRLIWAEGLPSKKLEGLKRRMEEIFKVKNENHPWLPHLTIARFKPEDNKKISAKIINEKISWKEKIESLALFESKLSPNGAKYDILYKVKL